MASTLEEKLAKDEEYLDYEHPKATEIKAQKALEQQSGTALAQNNAVYDSMINETDKIYKQQADAVEAWGQTQEQNQQDRTDFTIEQIEQQKAQSEKDYNKEQKGAYADYKKQTDEYGANAEAMASSGMGGTGYSESSKVSMYNQYQTRVAVAREAYNKAVLEYDNAIKDAQLQNNSALAEIAYTTLQQKLTLALAGFQTKNSLILEKLKQGLAIDEMYYNRKRDTVADSRWKEQWEYQKQQDALANRRYEDALKYQEERDALSDTRYDTEWNYQKDRDTVADDHWKKEYELAKQKASANSGEEVFADGYFTGDVAPSNVPGNNVKWISETTYVTDTHVKTPYYNGEKNADGKTYGYFANGYQPKGIKGHGEVHESYDENGKKNTVSYSTTTLTGESVVVKQDIWETDDGWLWAWDDKLNRYIILTDLSKEGIKSEPMEDIGTGMVVL